MKPKAFACLAALLAAIAALPALAQQIAASGTVIVYRGKGYEGIMNPFIRPEARLDGQVIGKCVKGEKITLQLAPGPHVLATTSESANDLAFTLAEGETICIRCTIAIGVLVPNFSLKRDDAKKCDQVARSFRGQ